MPRTLDTKYKDIEIECPHCGEEIKKEIVVDICEPDIDLKINTR